MGGFEKLPGAINQGQEFVPIQAEEVRPAGEDWDDDTALGIVLTDAMDTLAYLESKGLVPIGIENADDLYRAYVRPRQWADGKPRAALGMHVVMQAVEKVLPALHMSLFGQGKKRPFIVQARGKTTPAAARANASLLWWAFKSAHLKEEMRLSLKTALLYGFQVGCWGWESKKISKKVYKKNAEGKMVGTPKDIQLELPTYENLDLKMVMVDPGLKRQSVQDGAKFVIKQYFTDGYGLADLRDNPDYQNIPTDEQLAEILSQKAEPTTDTLGGAKRAVWREFQAKLESEATSKDPMAQPLEILEATYCNRVVTLLQRKIVIRNKSNDFGRLNFQSCAFIDVLNSAWGFGIARLLAGEQRLQQGVVNNGIDSLALTMSPVFQLLKNVGPGTQSIPVSPGKVLTLTGELKPLIVPDVTKVGLENIAASNERAMEKVGANGGMNMPNGAMRTAEGVQAFASDIITKLQYFLEIFIDLTYIPTLEAFLEMMHDHLTPEQINEILTAEEGQAYEGDIHDVYNAQVELDVLAGANMMARFAASQLAPLIIQLVSAGPVSDQLEVQGKKFNYVEFIDETLDMMGWDVANLVQDMTPAELQRVQQKNQATQQAMGKILLQQQKHSDDLENIDAKASGAAGVAVVRQILKSHEQEAVNAIEHSQEPVSA